MNKILLLGSQHGNELLGEQLYAYIASNRLDLLPFITFKRGNLRAYRQKVRYIESDLNRSYTGGDTTYEERRANTILKYIKKQDFDLVLDLHTTTCSQPPCLIVAGITDDNRQFIRASSIEKIVHMNHEIVETSLIGVYSKSASIEVNVIQLTTKLMEQLTSDIDRYLHNAASKKTKTVYEVGDLLGKDEITQEQAEELRNFEMSPLGFYPILVGENSYKKYTKYLGFKAYKTYQSKV
ncbi:MAG TPA: succinylglutamate desuccinylase/aspartoacylase family protein [Candidatus Chromulinivoraceae bacterium]|nr:succinylglutamate desuccinylase/aspartoacylase family protein [Candidatus Chromulinivoraceae bacterium]